MLNATVRTSVVSLSLCASAMVCGIAPEAAADSPNSNRGPLLIVTAVDYEYEAVVSLLSRAVRTSLGNRQVSRGEIAGIDTVVVRAGWGKAHAAGATAIAIQRFRPSIVVMAGIAGGLDPSYVRSGDLVISKATFQHDLGEMSGGKIEIWSPETPLEQPYSTEPFTSPRYLVRAALEAARTVSFKSWSLPAGCVCEKDGRRKPQCVGEDRPVGRARPKICAGIIATGDSFVVDEGFAVSLARERNAVAVDMETAAVAQEATDHGVAFIAIRIIGDIVSGATGESLYYCLKPLSGPRLTAILEKVIPALGVASRQQASVTASPAEETCRDTSDVPTSDVDTSRARYRLRLR